MNWIKCESRTELNPILQSRYEKSIHHPSNILCNFAEYAFTTKLMGKNGFIWIEYVSMCIDDVRVYYIDRSPTVWVMRYFRSDLLVNHCDSDHTANARDLLDCDGPFHHLRINEFRSKHGTKKVSFRTTYHRWNTYNSIIIIIIVNRNGSDTFASHLLTINT